MISLLFLIFFVSNSGSSFVSEEVGEEQISLIKSKAKTIPKADKKYAVFIKMAMPSNKKRLFLTDLSTRKIIHSSYVAHGKGSGRGQFAEKFSDEPGSYCTAPGLYKVGKNYKGKHGDSFELIGLDSTNKNAVDRAIVIHTAWYCEEEFVKKYNRCGNSWGCPAVSESDFLKLKPYLAKGILVYVYS